jgi:hypothetical protein
MAATDIGSLSTRLASLDIQQLRSRYAAQGAFLSLDEFLPPEITASLIEAAALVEPSINRNYLPGHKQGGSVSRHTIDQQAAVIAQLYRSPALLQWLEQLTGEKLQLSPADDPHAYALYFYTKPGDHIGWHYDTSYYAGRRYTLLLGVIDRSSCRAPPWSPARCRFPPVGWWCLTATSCVIALRRWVKARCACL